MQAGAYGRANVSRTVRPGSVVNVYVGEQGQVRKTTDENAHEVNVVSGNAAAPTWIAGGGIAMSMSYNAFLGLTEETGPGG